MNEIQFCYKHPTQIAHQRAFMDGAFRHICDLCATVLTAKWIVKRGDPCWEGGCTEGVVYKLTGPPHSELLFGGLKATLQASTYLCSAHAIAESVKDPNLILEEL